MAYHFPQSALPILGLLQKGNYKQARLVLSTSEDLWSDPEGLAEALNVRILLEEGKIGLALEKATQICKSAESPPFFPSLYYHFIRHYAENPLHEYRILKSLEPSGCSALDYRYLFFLDLFNRSTSFLLIYHILPQSAWPSIIENLQKLANGYHEVGLFSEGLAAERTALEHLYTKLRKEEQVIVELKRLVAKSQGLGDLISAGKAQLFLAEIQATNWFRKQFTGSIQDVVAQFEEAISFLSQGQHQFAEALVSARMAKLFLNYGMPEGETLALQTIQLLENTPELQLKSQVWGDLDIWYRQRGNAALAINAHHEVGLLNDQLAVPVGKNRKTLTEIDAFLRKGKISQAKEKIALAYKNAQSIESPLEQSLVAVLEANAHSQINLYDDAASTLMSAIKVLEPSGICSQLAQLYERLSEINFHTRNWIQARKHIEQAIQISIELADFPAAGDYTSRLAWMLSLQAAEAHQIHTALPNIIEIYSRAQSLLLRDPTITAIIAIGESYNNLALLHLQANQLEKYFYYLEEASKLFQTYDLKQNLCFNLIMQGLAKMDFGLKKLDHALLAQARTAFLETEHMLAALSLESQLWRLYYYLGMNASYQIRISSPDSDLSLFKQETYYYLEKMGQELDQLREDTNEGLQTLGQQTLIAFGLDKQKAYSSAFLVFSILLNDGSSAWRWLERMKNRALLDALQTLFPKQIPNEIPSWSVIKSYI